MVQEDEDLKVNVDLPLVTCIMPTRNRTGFVARAIDCFLKQDYPRKFLVIVEDGESNCGDLLLNRVKLGGLHDKPDEFAGWCQTSKGVQARDQIGGAKSNIHHFHLGQGHRTIGEKRNIACDFARAYTISKDYDLIAHWDDDDWHSPRRLSTQIEQMRAKNAQLSGLDRLIFFDGERAQLFQTPRKPWLAGGTLIYERSLWLEQPFEEVSDGEDTAFVDRAYKRGVQIATVDDPSLYVAMIHNSNTTKRNIDAKWGNFDVDKVRGWLEGSQCSV